MSLKAETTLKITTKYFNRKRADSDPGDETHETIDVRVFPDGVKPAEVKAGMGVTINLGNFESLRIEMSVAIPCYSEEVPNAQDYAMDLVQKKLLKKAKKLAGQLKDAFISADA